MLMLTLNRVLFEAPKRQSSIRMVVFFLLAPLTSLSHCDGRGAVNKNRVYHDSSKGSKLTIFLTIGVTGSISYVFIKNLYLS